MSLEAALDEERREIMGILEGKASQQANPLSRREQNDSPVPAIRSMLDVSSVPAPRHGSIAGIGVGVTPASPRSSVRSLLDPQSPTSPSLHTNTSPTSPPASSRPRQRSSSDASQSLPRVGEKQKVDIDSDYQFEMLPSIANQALPKRVGQTGKIGGFTAPTAMAAAMSGDLGTLPNLGQGRETSRQRSALSLNRTSRSPSGRPGRSSSPGSALNSSTPSKYVTDSGRVINLDKAYRRLSDAALLKSGGTLSEAARKNRSAKERGGSADSESPDGQGRLEKDYPLEEEDQEGAVESSADESGVSTSDEEHKKPESARGRSRKKRAGKAEKDRDESSEEKTGVGTKGSKPVKSLLSAMEEERKTVSSQLKPKRYSEPSISITSPAGERLTPKKSGVHPHTSFDYTASGVESALSSDEEEDTSQIKRAQKLSINLSPIDRSVPNRAIRTILRGDFNKMQQDALEGTRRQRLYLVATDLSDEAVYALEWTIGTILRDGDTLFAIYAAEDESAPRPNEESNFIVQIGEGSKAVEDAVSTLESLTEKAMSQPVSANAPVSLPSFMPATAPGSRAGSRETRSQPKLEGERTRAIEDITSTCLRLLRKTRLQARVAIEVIHCKSPKHMITEAIDGLEPTLVILGSRGRSALKGVLLGSFSNYLVTKSSVPVMVARKKLRKHAKFKNTSVRLSNNLTNQKRLVTAKID